MGGFSQSVFDYGHENYGFHRRGSMWGQENMVFIFGARFGVEKYGFHGHDSVFGCRNMLFLSRGSVCNRICVFSQPGIGLGVEKCGFHSREGGRVGPAGRAANGF